MNLILKFILDRIAATFNVKFSGTAWNDADFEKILVDQGHRLKDCEWMLHSDDTLNKIKVEL